MKAQNENNNLRVTIIVNTKMAYANNDNNVAEQLEDTGGHSGRAGQQRARNSPHNDCLKPGQA